MYLLVTNKPKSRREASKWKFDGLIIPKPYKSNRTVDDRLWWAFRTEAAAKKVQEMLQLNNQGTGMRITLRKVDRIPSGWL